MSIIAYARVCKSDENPQTQLDALINQGYHYAYTDKDRNWSELAKAIATLRQGDVLLFWKLDRLARSIVHLGEIAEQVRSKGAHLKCVGGSIDTTSANGHVIFDVIWLIAQFESNVILERTKAGMAAARAEGRIGGWKKGKKRGKRKRVLVPRMKGTQDGSPSASEPEHAPDG